MGAPVTASAWFEAEDAVAFGLADGTLALARTRWDGAATLRPRTGGGVELVQATAPPPPTIRIGVHAGPCLAIASTAGSVVSGGGDGRFARVTAGGEATTLATFPGERLDCVAGHGDVEAVAIGPRVQLSGRTPARLELPGPVQAMAFDPAGRHLAVAFDAGVMIRSDDTERVLPCAGRPSGLAWSPDGRYLACLQDDALAVWQLPDGVAVRVDPAGPSSSLSFAPSGGFVATGGRTRITCWRLDDAACRRTECGPGGDGVEIRKVACHPTRDLIAAGYENGAVLLIQPGSADVLFVRAAGGGGVSTLAWSADGALAIGTEAGECGVVVLGELLFRAQPEARKPT